jgi:glutathione synthase
MQARQLIEVSCAAKCPTVAYQLAGSKKVQQDIARPGVVERFMGAEQGAALRQLFAGEACCCRRWHEVGGAPRA